MTTHGWTTHGHTCCNQPGPPIGDRPQMVARCGGPAICTGCAQDAARIHAATDTTYDVRQALKDAIGRVITIQGDVAEVIAGSGRAASAKSRAYGGLTQLADHLRAAVDALDGAS